MQVDLGTHTVVVEIYAGFDGDRRSRKQSSVIVGLEVVQMHPVPVYLFPQTVAGAMYKLIAESSVSNVVPGNPVDFPALQRFSGLYCLLDQFDGGVTTIANDSERFRVSRWHRSSAVTHPSDIGVDGAWRRYFAP